MKTKLGDIGLGFVSLLLFVQILWLAYNFFAIETVHPFLWEQLGSTFVLAVGFVFLWRTTTPQQQPRLLQSFVLLLRSPRNLTIEQFRHTVERALEVTFTQKDSHTIDTITDIPPTLRVRVDGYMFRVNNAASPYIDQTENTPENIPNVRLQQMVRDHTAWLSVDVLESPNNATFDDIYRRLGRMIAALSGDDCVGLCCPETNQLNLWRADLIAYLQSDTPLQALAELTEVPAIRVTANDTQMQEASQKANSMWSVFVHAFEQRHSDQTFAVKAPFTDGQETEYMWLIVCEITDEAVIGTLDNDPIYLRNIGAGSLVSVALDQVNDWLYTDGGELVGGFTTEAITKQIAA